MTHTSTATKLATSQKSRLCDEPGIIPAIKQAMRRGEVVGYDTAEDYLTDVLEGRAPDNVAQLGWALCQSQDHCARAGRCLRTR